MKEGLDIFVKNKIDTLEYVPGIQFDENTIWDRIEPNVISKPRGGLHLFISLMAVGLSIMIYVLFLTSATLKQPDEKIIVPVKDKNVIPIKEVTYDSTILPKENVFVEKKKIQKPIVIKKPPIKTSKIKISKTKPTKKSYVAKKKHVVIKNGQINYTRLPDRSTKKIRQKEVMISVSKAGFSVGVNYVNSISKQTSFAYGLQMREVNLHRLDNRYMHDLTAIHLEIPIEFRYYLGKKKGRFCFYMYSRLVNSFSLKPIDDISTYNLGFESGAAIQYRIFRSKNGKHESFIGVRLPIYNSNLIHRNYTRPSLLGSGIKK